MQEIIDYIQQHSLDYQTKPVIAKAVSQGLNLSYTEAYSAINNLMENGDICQVGNLGKLALSKTLGYKKGKLTGNARGFAFARILDEEVPDVFIPHCSLKNALHKDTVLLSVKRKVRILWNCFSHFLSLKEEFLQISGLFEIHFRSMH